MVSPTAGGDRSVITAAGGFSITVEQQAASSARSLRGARRFNPRFNNLETIADYAERLTHMRAKDAFLSMVLSCHGFKLGPVIRFYMPD